MADCARTAEGILMISRRLGRFTVTRDLIDDNFGEVIYRGLVPLEVRYEMDSDRWEVLAVGPQFDPVPRGLQAPRYTINLVRDEGPSRSFSAVFTKEGTVA